MMNRPDVAVHNNRKEMTGNPDTRIYLLFSLPQSLPSNSIISPINIIIVPWRSYFHLECRFYLHLTPIAPHCRFQTYTAPDRYVTRIRCSWLDAVTLWLCDNEIIKFEIKITQSRPLVKLNEPVAGAVNIAIQGDC
jgi:hypothetical protein